jgi:hypothetical protein
VVRLLAEWIIRYQVARTISCLPLGMDKRQHTEKHVFFGSAEPFSDQG